MTKDRAALKAALKARMLELEEAELAVAIEHYDAHLRDAKLDDREQHDIDDIADAAIEVGLAEAFDHPVHTHQAKLSALQEMDFSLRDSVGLGSVVVFGGKHFVASVATARFDCGGVTYMGISPQSPVFKALDGLEAGDTFTLNGRDMTLDDVY